MKAASWLVLAVLLAFPSLGWAGPFTAVPPGHWAYGECAYLAGLGLIGTGLDFTGKHELSRYEFSMALAAPVEGLARAGQTGSTAAQAVCSQLSALTPVDRKKAGESLVRLVGEFRDALAFVGQDTDKARKQAKELASGVLPSWLARPPISLRPSGVLASGRETAAGLAYELGSGRLALRYSETPAEEASLGHIGLAVPGGGLTPTKGSGSLANTATRDPLVRSLRGSLEYGLTNDLTLDLAYERMVREGRGMVNLDTTDLRSLGLGYRLSPSASLKLRYHVIEYNEPNAPAPRYQDRLTEGRLSISF